MLKNFKVIKCDIKREVSKPILDVYTVISIINFLL